jgi:hypothetical protein
MFTGIAMASPLAVVSRATLIPPATSPGSTSPASSMAAKARIIPATVPRKPIRGATLATVARTTRPRSRNPSSMVPTVLMACSISPALTFFCEIRLRPAYRMAAAGPGVAAAIWTASSMLPARAASSTSLRMRFVL